MLLFRLIGASCVTIEEPGRRGQRSTFENVPIDEISGKSNTLKNGILQMTWDSFEIVRTKYDYKYEKIIMMDYVFSLVTSDGENYSLLEWKECWTPKVICEVEKRLSCICSSFRSCFVPVWTFLWPPAHLMDKLCFYCHLYFNKPKLLTLMLLSVVNVSKRITFEYF